VPPHQTRPASGSGRVPPVYRGGADLTGPYQPVVTVRVTLRGPRGSISSFCDTHLTVRVTLRGLAVTVRVTVREASCGIPTNRGGHRGAPDHHRHRAAEPGSPAGRAAVPLAVGSRSSGCGRGGRGPGAGGQCFAGRSPGDQRQHRTTD